MPKTIAEWQKKRAALKEKALAILDAADARGEMTAQDEVAHAELERDIAACTEEIERLQRHAEQRCAELQGKRPAGDTGSFKTLGEFLSALDRKQRGDGYDERLRPFAASVGGTSGAEGGFWIPSYFSQRMWGEDVADSMELLNNVDKVTVPENAGREVRVPRFVDSDHSSSAPFSIDWYWTAEGAAVSGSYQAIDSQCVTFVPKRLGALFSVNREWLQDSFEFAQTRLENALRASLRWELEKSLWHGTGAGQVLGVINSGALSSVAKSTGQSGGTLILENVLAMWERLRAGAHSRARWVCSASAFSQICQLGISVGTGGAPVFVPATGVAGSAYASLMGRPLTISEFLPTAGSVGDLVLYDPAAYLLVYRTDIEIMTSEHLKFAENQIVYRCIVRCDGSPLTDTTLTDYQSETRAAFVTTAVRS